MGEEDLKKVRYEITQEDIIQLGLILQVCARSGDWSLAGITPNPKCSKCNNGVLGRNTTTDQMILCKCITSQIQQAMKYLKDVKAFAEKENAETRKVEEKVDDGQETEVTRTE